MKNTGLVLKEIRTMKKLTQAELSELSGVSKADLSQYERGKKKLTIRKLKGICKPMKIPKEVIAFLSIDENDVSKDKRESFKQISPAVKSMMKHLLNG